MSVTKLPTAGTVHVKAPLVSDEGTDPFLSMTPGSTTQPGAVQADGVTIAVDASGVISSAQAFTNVHQLLAQTASFGPTVFFTAPADGFYMFSALARITATDAAGTMTITITKGLDPPAINPALPSPIPTNVRAIFLATNATVSMTGTAAGLTATTFNVYLFAARLA